MRRFNVTTNCVRELHYMADVSKKLDQIIDMIETGYYFTINRARQKGKTTILELLEEELNEKYLVVLISLEGRSSVFESEQEFAKSIFDIFAEPFAVNQPAIAKKIKGYGQYNIHAYNKGIMYSIFKNDNGNLAIHNKIFELVLYEYLIAEKNREERGSTCYGKKI